MVTRGRRRDTEMVDKLRFASMAFCSPETAYESKAVDLLQNQTCN